MLHHANLAMGRQRHSKGEWCSHPCQVSLQLVTFSFAAQQDLCSLMLFSGHVNVLFGDEGVGFWGLVLTLWWSLSRWELLFAPFLLEEVQQGRLLCATESVPEAVGTKVSPRTLTWVLQLVFQLGMKPVCIVVVLLRQRLKAHSWKNKFPSKSGNTVG